MEVKDQLLAILNKLNLDSEIKAKLIATVEEGPITKSLVDDIINTLEVLAMEQDKIEELENKKADLYEEAAAKLSVIAEGELAEGEKNLGQLADDLTAIKDEAKAHLTSPQSQVATPAMETARPASVPTVPTM